MLILDKDKENLLVEKYGFTEVNTIDNNKFYKYGVSFTIYGASYSYRPLHIVLSSFSKKNQDMLYLLIKENVIKYIEEDDNLIEIIQLRSKIKVLKEKLNKMEAKNENNKTD